MVLINNLTVDEINAALIHLQRSRNEVVGGEKGDTVQNITINNQGGGADYSSVINAIENRVKNTETNINTLDSSQRMLALETAGMQEQIADIYNTLLSMSQNNITDISWDDTNRVLVINTTSMSYEVAIPSETVALSLEGNVLTFTMGEQTTSVTLNYIPTSEKGVANGVATLDSSGRIPYSQLPESAMEFLGEWDASTNTPHLEDGTGDNGDFYVVSVGGTVNFGTQAEPRNITFYPNDRVVYEGSLDKWFRLPAGEVRTVNGLSGDVVLNGTNVNYDGTNNSPTLKSKIDSVETKAETQADWNISDSTNLAYIKNKPALKTVAVTGSYNDLTNKPTIPAAQIQSDWTQTDTTKKDFIKNKIPIWITQESASDNMQPVDSVTEGDTRPVTSNAVAEIMKSLPTDAVLHYSFDEVPDYPDGTADIRLLNNNTYDIQSGGYKFIADGDATFSNSNGKLLITISSSVSFASECGIGSNPIASKCIKFRIKVQSITSGGTLRFYTKRNVPINITSVGEYVYTYNEGTENRLSFYVTVGATATFTVEQIYIGNGSYTTPVIDNANGQNNGTNKGGIATQGLSGKGAYFPSATQEVRIPITNLPAPTSNDNFTISCWLKINSDYVNDTNGSTVKPIVSIGISSATGVVGLARRSDTIEYINRDSSNVRTVETPMKKDGKWHNYIGVYDGTTHKSTLYEDGVLIGTSNANLANYQFGNSVAYWQVWSNTTITGVTGNSTKQPSTIDDLLIFNRALSQEEVTALYLNKANTPKYYSWADWKLSQM